MADAIGRQRVGGTPLSASIGTATCPPSGDLRDALKTADAEMYDAKRRRPPRPTALPVDRRGR
jgi:GGDEF domain-containing protein